MNASTYSQDPARIPAQQGLLSGKVALVLGGSRGIGAASARALARAGARVVVAARDERGLGEVAESIRASGGEALPVRTDIRDAAQVKALIDQTVSVYGRLDAAFNNAGSGHRPAPFSELTVEDIDESISVNLRGILVAMKLELAAMLARGGGSIINMSSTAGLSGVRGMGAYSATKHAIIGASKSAALDHASQKIRVNVVAPGPILTDRIRDLPEERRAPIVRAVPMERIGLPEEVAATVVWLCSDAASFITGAVLPIDGGRLAGGA
ncbi:SDR family NAD(P)-dependent oxidoreductase [Vitiosangium sp. GDMCC 1.1324]|uniref:SDR family NAD(P)-dependent oxidoreductase n=1 Tax=Vitiosangium sp. (strain GDMCC 1.1324) TaxID=2138576 RepID=UPI000D3CC8E9|nr:glucose 1-dehydrogenase [Vitiosangium sp. GDMCC 1.1324]PTL85694.1 short-chain dehydrogenase [Vitiosangium sp. GDMCC 1.1324]